jgi:hypothetical protein
LGFRAGAVTRAIGQWRYAVDQETECRRKAASEELSRFVRLYARKAYPQRDPNDRSYDRQIEAEIQRMDPIALDALLREGDE